MPRAKCKAKNKAGKPCGSRPLKGRDLCLAHIPESERKSRGFGGAQKGAGRPRKLKPSEVLRQRLEERIDEIFNPLLDALKAERALVVGNGRDAHLELAPDHPTRIAAAREIWDRIEGRPKQATELSGPDGGPIPTEQLVPTGEEWEKGFVSAMAEAGLVPANGASRNGSG